MIRGTRYLFGKNADLFDQITTVLKGVAISRGYKQFIPSSLSEQDIFVQKAGGKILDQMYSFTDKGDRSICLIPEVTAIVQKIYNEEWKDSLSKPIKSYYLTRCYRYDRPQAGRYREFWQFGIEILGNKSGDREEALQCMWECMNQLSLCEEIQFNSIRP
jgi:histidyl-tRNA synthetase